MQKHVGAGPPPPHQKETNVPQQKCIVVLDPFPALTLAAWCEDCDRLQRQQGSQQVEPQTFLCTAEAFLFYYFKVTLFSC